MLIDTGGKASYSKQAWQKRDSVYSIGEYLIIPYLKSIGIKKLDYLILTHGDDDHMGEGINIINNFKVNNVIMNNNSLTLLEKKLIIVLNNKKIKYKLCEEGNIIRIDKYQLQILNPVEKERSENDNSLVIYTKLNSYNLLFMGDVSIDIENRLINMYKLPKMDILKVGHHGSITSTSNEFLDTIKPKYAVIEVGLNNKFNHPSKIVIERLKTRNIKYFLTSLNGSIKFLLMRQDVTFRTTTS